MPRLTHPHVSLPTTAPIGTRRITCVLGFAVLLALTSAESRAHDGHAPPAKAKPAEVYAPSVVPDRVVLTWADDPARSMAVTWRTSTEVHSAFAEIAKATGRPDFGDTAERFPAKTEALETDLNTAHFHAVRFQNLEPDTRYVYRVGDGNNWSEWFQFSTAPANADRFSFVYFGDAQNDVRSRWSRVVREAYRDAPKAAFFLHAGDLINRAEADAEWGEWFLAGGFINAMTPSIVLPGNHEYGRSLLGGRKLSHHWRPQFTLPENGPESLPETCYTIVYGNTRIIALNSNEDYDIQATWLREVLANNTARWVICTFHHPIFSTSARRDNPQLRETWKPILDEYRVDLVLQGHDHTYGRTGIDTPRAAVPPTKENVPAGVTNVDTHSGTVYVVSVSGPKMYNLAPKPFMVRTAEQTQLYQVIHIDGDQLKFEARTAAGELYDAFTLTKREGQPNQIEETFTESTKTR